LFETTKEAVMEEERMQEAMIRKEAVEVGQQTL